jgi:chromosome segregation ATPase
MESFTAQLHGAFGEAAAQARLWFDATSLHPPGTLAAMAVLALCLTASLVILDASRRTAAVPTWSYLRRDIAQLAAERDGKIGTVGQLASEVDELRAEVDMLRAEKRTLDGVRQQREQEENRLNDITARMERYEEDEAIIDLTRVELDALKAEKAGLEERIDVLREEEASSAGQMDRLRTRLTRLDEDVERAKATRLGLRGDVAQLERERDLILRHLDSMRVDLRQVEEKRKHAADELELTQSERERLVGEMKVIHGSIAQLERERQRLEDKIVSAQGRRTKLLEGNGRLEAERSGLWIEFVSLQEKRKAVLSEISNGEANVRELRLKRDALHGEIEMLKRVFSSGREAEAAALRFG